MAHMGFIGLYVTIHTFCQWWDKCTVFYTQGGYARMLPYSHLIGNETRVLYGRIWYWYTRMISCIYMLVYRTVANAFRIVMNNAQLISATVWIKLHMFNLCIDRVIPHDARDIIPSCNWSKCLSYTALYLLMWVSDLLIHSFVIVSNIICMIGQALKIFPDLYRTENNLHALKYWVMYFTTYGMVLDTLKSYFAMKSKTRVLTQ